MEIRSKQVGRFLETHLGYNLRHPEEPSWRWRFRKPQFIAAGKRCGISVSRQR
jgi:hypothetical protein